MEINRGTVVISSAGHDSGHWFVVTGAVGGYVFIADGKERRLLSPKKKNLKHIRVTSKVIAEEDMTDRKLRKTLNAMCAESIAEESE